MITFNSQRQDGSDYSQWALNPKWQSEDLGHGVPKGKIDQWQASRRLMSTSQGKINIFQPALRWEPILKQRAFIEERSLRTSLMKAYCIYCQNKHMQ